MPWQDLRTCGARASAPFPCRVGLTLPQGFYACTAAAALRHQRGGRRRLTLPLGLALLTPLRRDPAAKPRSSLALANARIRVILPQNTA